MTTGSGKRPPYATLWRAVIVEVLLLVSLTALLVLAVGGGAHPRGDLPAGHSLFRPF